MHQSELDFTNNLRQASPYIAKHRNKTIVIYLPGELIFNSEALQQLAKDIEDHRRFQGTQDIVEFPDIVERQLVDPHAPARQDGHEPLGLQLDQGIAQRGLADAQ